MQLSASRRNKELLIVCAKLCWSHGVQGRSQGGWKEDELTLIPPERDAGAKVEGGADGGYGQQETTHPTYSKNDSGMGWKLTMIG